MRKPSLYIAIIAFLFLGASTSYAAISLDSCATFDSGATKSSPQTFSLTTSTSSNRMLWVAVSNATADGDKVTGVSYASVALTKITSIQDSAGDNRYVSLWYLIAPNTGTNTVSITYTAGTSEIYATACGYIGVDPLTTIGSNSKTTAVTSMVNTITTTADNSWTVLAEIGARAPTASTGAIKRTSSTVSLGVLFDSGSSITPAQAYSMTVTQADASAAGWIIASFKPYVANTGRSTIVINHVSFLNDDIVMLYLIAPLIACFAYILIKLFSHFKW